MDLREPIIDRCILFPRSDGAVSTIEDSGNDSRFEIDVIEFDRPTFSKLQLFGFFSYPNDTGITIRSNSFVKIAAELVPIAIVIALEARKATNEPELQTFIDRFVNAATQSSSMEMPIWFST